MKSAEDLKGMDKRKPLVLYDGDCGLCHGFVQYVLARDPEGVFCFSPLQGETVKTVTHEHQRNDLPDSIVVLTEDGVLLIRSDAVCYVLSRLSGASRQYATVMKWIPKGIRDIGYRIIASIRSKVFKKPEDVCPLVPLELRSRFLP